MNGKLLHLYLIELPKNATSCKIFNVCSVFSLWVQTEKNRTVKKAPYFYRFQKFCHVALNCHIKSKYVGCRGDYLSQEYKAKTTSPEVPKPPP